jgi:hypothetical protein
MASEPTERKKGPWKDEAESFAEYKEAIREVLNKEAQDSVWSVELEVRKSGNPIHQYRVVLGPPS